jgi:plasmid stabilization system protein ParE
LILVWSPEAFAELRKERQYLSRRSATGARNQLGRIRSAARALLTFPEMSTRVRFEEQSAFVFVVPGTEYLLIYDIQDQMVRIRRVWSGRRSRPPFEGRSSQNVTGVKALGEGFDDVRRRVSCG